MMPSGTLGRLLRDIRRLVGRPSRPVFVQYAPAAIRLVGRTCRIAAIDRLTADAVSVTLEDPTGAPIAFVPGEFLTVLVTIDGAEHRRAYSVCSSRRELPLVRIGIKRVPGGRVSTHLSQRARVGDTIEVFGPSGTFTVALDPGARRRYVLVAGGSGITPLLAIARGVVEEEPRSSVALVYGNRSVEDAMFRDELAELQRVAPERFHVRHVLETGEPGPATCLGRLTGDVLAAELEALHDPGADDWYFICGPEPVMDAARRALADRGVPDSRVRLERFTPPTRVARRSQALRSAHSASAHQGGRTYRFDVADDTTLLEAGRAAGVPMPYSCTVGGCGSCRVRLLSGEIDADEPNCLLPDERAAGWVLACVTRARSAVEIDLGPARVSDLTNQGVRP